MNMGEKMQKRGNKSVNFSIITLALKYLLIRFSQWDVHLLFVFVIFFNEC